MANYRKLARGAARRYGIDPSVFARQINLESGYNPNALSPAGAIGIAQFMPGTARSEGVNPRDPRSALLGAARLDAKLIKQTGSYRKALAAYNAGPSNIPAGLGYADKILGGRIPQGSVPSAPQSPAPSAYGGDSRQQIALSLLGLGGLAGGSYGGGQDPLTAALLQATQQQGRQGAQHSYGASPVAHNAIVGSPLAGVRPHAATHQTEGLPGYPAFDYMARAGTPVVAPVSGKIIKLSGHDPSSGPTSGPHGPFGWSVYVQGDNGATYFLTHLGSRNVRVGQRVRQGAQIGSIGNYAKWGGADHVHVGVHSGR